MSYLTTLQGLPGVSSIWLLDEASGTSFADSQGTLTATGAGTFAAGGTSIVTALAHSATNTSGVATTGTGYAVGTGDFWLAGWFKTTSGGVIGVFGGANSNNVLYLNGGNIALNLAGGGVFSTSGLTLSDGNPHFFCVSRISNTANLYLDGNTTATATGSSFQNWPTSIYGLGACGDGSLPFPGTIGGFAIGVGSGITGAQAATIYAAGNSSGGLAAGTLSVTGHTSTSISLSTTAATGGTSPYTYKLQRAPDVSGSPGSFADVGSFQSGLTWTDSGLSSSTTYWYQVISKDSAGSPATVTGNQVSQATDTPSNTVTIASPVANQFRWWGATKSSGSASFTLSGTYSTGATSIEWSKDGSTWTTLGGTFSGGNYSNTITLPAGQYTVSVRWSNDHTVTASVAHVTVGPVVAIYGQSNASGRGTNNQVVYPTPGVTHVEKTDTGYAVLADPVAGTTDHVGSATGSWVPAMVSELGQLLGYAVGIVPCGQGGQAIANLQKGGGGAYDLYFQPQVAAVGGCDCVIWWQGENDFGSSQATYHSALSTLVGSIRSDFSCPVLVTLLQQCDTGTYSQVNQDAINAALAQGAGDITGCKLGADLRAIPTMPEDNVHLRTDAKLCTAGAIQAGRVYEQVYQPASGGGNTYSRGRLVNA